MIGSEQVPGPAGDAHGDAHQGRSSRSTSTGRSCSSATFFAVTMELCGVKSLSFAVGRYLPLSTTLPIFVGGALKGVVDGSPRGAASAWRRASSAAGSLFATGLVAGGALTGVIVALAARERRREPLHRDDAQHGAAHRRARSATAGTSSSGSHLLRGARAVARRPPQPPARSSPPGLGGTNRRRAGQGRGGCSWRRGASPAEPSPGSPSPSWRESSGRLTVSRRLVSERRTSSAERTARPARRPPFALLPDPSALRRVGRLTRAPRQGRARGSNAFDPRVATVYRRAARRRLAWSRPRSAGASSARRSRSRRRWRRGRRTPR